MQYSIYGGMQQLTTAQLNLAGKVVKVLVVLRRYLSQQRSIDILDNTFYSSFSLNVSEA